MRRPFCTVVWAYIISRLRISPWPKICYLLADAYATDGRLDEAARHVDEVLAVPETAPDVRGRALLLKGDIYEQQERRDEAARAFAEALPLHPNPAVVQSRIDYLKTKPQSIAPAS